MCVLTPFWAVVGVLGMMLLTLVLGLTCLPPLLAILFVISAEYWLALATLAVWVLWLRFGSPIRRVVFEGFDNGGL